MKSFTLLSAVLPALVAAHAIPAPLGRRTDTSITDAGVMNFALTLEHLETTFYTQGLANFTADDFVSAGYPSWVRQRYEEILTHESTHVAFLTAAIQELGEEAVEACTYDFSGATDVTAFISMSGAFETVGASAYSGSANMLTDKNALAAAATILSIEARQSSWIAASVQGANPWSGSFEVDLTPNQIYSIASGFISSCPSSNPELIATAFPTLTMPAYVRPGLHVAAAYELPVNSSTLYAAIMTSDGTEFQEVAGTTFVIPAGARGTVFVAITNSNQTVSDETVVAGPVPLMFPYDAEGAVLQ